MNGRPGTPHRIQVTREQFGGPDVPALFGAQCSCGWVSSYLRSDPEGAEELADDHREEIRNED